MSSETLAKDRLDNDSADVTSSVRSFHVRGSTTDKAWLATVVSLTEGNAIRPG